VTELKADNYFDVDYKEFNIIFFLSKLSYGRKFQLELELYDQNGFENNYILPIDIQA
jgi:hypothetical protein